jgi:hypothetical protein
MRLVDFLISWPLLVALSIFSIWLARQFVDYTFQKFHWKTTGLPFLFLFVMNLTSFFTIIVFLAFPYVLYIVPFGYFLEFDGPSDWVKLFLLFLSVFYAGLYMIKKYGEGSAP